MAFYLIKTSKCKAAPSKKGGGGLQSTEVVFLLITQRPPVFFLATPKIEIDLDTEIYRQRWLEGSGQRLENVDRTLLVLASGKLVQQKKSITEA